MYEDITQKILDLLEANNTLKVQVKKFYFGERNIKKPHTRFPFIDCKWTGGPVKKQKTGTVITRRTISFRIRCIAQHYNENEAEKKVMELTEVIETVLDANEKLGNLVETSTITEVYSDSMEIGGYSVVGSFTTLTVKLS